ncbi:MAG: hypothetical protein KUG79_08275 [Pseudomonadales bacterium]|nr:hypothetical protein [Pseudomonadales bacterium]
MKLVKFECKKLFARVANLSLMLLLVLPFSSAFAHPQDQALNLGHYMTHPEVLVVLFAMATAVVVRFKLKKTASKR